MPLSDKFYVLVSRYVRRQTPKIGADNLGPYVQDELREIESAIRVLTEASVQASEREPEAARVGMIRYAVQPWNPLGNGFEGLVVYNGTTWVAV